MSYSPWGHKESDMTEQLTHTHTHKLNFFAGSVVLPENYYIHEI